MLGKLAKKLRILGFDAEYYADIGEDEILEKSKGRILLTRDKILYRKALKRGLRAFYIKSDKWRSQLKAVSNLFPIEENAKPFTRCSVCNTPLKDVEKEEVRGKVPEYVYMTHEQFKICPKCGKVYWKGSHMELIRKDMGKLVKVWKV